MSFIKFRVLMWKNWTLQKRRPVGGAIQVLFPILIVILVTWARNSFGNQFGLLDRTIQQTIELKNFSLCTFDDIYPSGGTLHPLKNVYFSPNNDAYTALINDAFGNDFTIFGYENSSVMVNAFYNGGYEQQVGIVLTSDSEVSTELPKKITYEIIQYFYTGSGCELTIQNELERNFLIQKTGSFPTEAIMRAFPYENLFKQIFTELMIYMLPFFLVISLFTTVSGVLKSVSSEQKTKVKELMKIMGLSKTLHWLSWYTKWMIMSVVSYTVVTIFLCIPIIGSTAIFSLSNFFLIWIFFVFFCSSVITFCFLICVLFQKAPTNDGIGVILFFATYIPYYVYGTRFFQLAYGIKWLICLSVNSSLGIAISMALNAEVNLQGITFSNLFTHMEGFQFSFGEVLICLIFTSVIHILITVYIELVFPGDVGVPKPWYFPVQSFINLIRKKDDNPFDVRYSRGSIDLKKSNDYFEEDPKHLNPTVKIENLTKYFGSSIAVNNLSLNMYQDQIFVLCGHNGAGKTTVMNMLIGMTPPTSGSAYINGYDINTEIDKARNSIGICLQDNILFNDLTVSEHIIFFCRLKGMKNSSKINDEVEKYLSMLGLDDKKDKKSKSLSGGQKRRLSIANALCGDSTFVILDEPTSGLDVKARRCLWDLLIEEKKGRTILLSTHYMEEAEVLSDRIGIMNEGKLKTIGTSFFLKKKFGSGYRLIIVKKENCRSSLIKNAIQSLAPDVLLESEEQMEVTFVLSEEYLDKFDRIFKRLEDDADKLGISSFGCSISNLEEVFLKVGADDVQNVQQNGHDTAVKLTNPFVSTNEVSTVRLFFNQIYALILKKFHFTRRNTSPYIFLAIFTGGLTAVFLAVPVTLVANVERGLTGLIDTANPESNISRTYKTFFQDENVEVINEDIRDFIYKNFMKRNLNYEVGVSFDINPVSVWFNAIENNGKELFSLNYFHRAILKSFPSFEDCDIRRASDKYDETTSSTTLSPDNQEIVSQFQELLIYLLFLFVMIYWPSVHIMMRIKERVTKAKLLQFISGVNRFSYTMVSYLIDFAILFSVLCIVFGVVAATGRSGFNTTDDVTLYMTIFTFYSFNIIAWIYLISFLFKNPIAGESAASKITLGFLFLYILYAILHHALRIHKTALTFSIIIFNIGIFFAPFSIINVYEKIQVTKYIDGMIWRYEDGIGENLLKMGIGTIVFLSIIFMKDFLIFTWIKYKFLSLTSKRLSLPNPTGDDDVQREIERVKSKSASQILKSHLVLDGLTKFYGNNLAVNQLHVSVESAECFGILGVNGAGKTTTFKMMTGDEIISSGDGFIHGNDLKSQMTRVYRKIGYCPQFDALLPDLSGRETLKIFCLLRGIPNGEIDEIIKIFAKELGFEKHLDKKVENFSGGNKRKLSTALALIGNVSLVFLDECSSGMDPKAKRNLWEIINKTRNSGKAVILTSHSMQECESLCTKLAIMVDGSFSCIGSIQHLKNKFSTGFVLTVKMSKRDDESNLSTVLNRVKQSFPTAELKEKFLELLTFHINSSDIKWSRVFAELAEIKREVGISDYTMTQSSLESVFLFFSKQGKKIVE